MPASRWQTGLNELLQWNEEEENELLSLIMPSMLSRFQKKDSNSSESDPSQMSNQAKYPEILPILPLRGVVVYPQTAVPLTIGQPRSIRLVDEVVAGETRLVGLIASRDPDLETPEPNDLFSVGTVAVVHRLFRAPDNTIRLVVQGLARFRTSEYIQLEPYLKANIELIPEKVEEGSELEALARSAR